jgi:uncharacterized integral membrane protein (TIGR00698 family)
MTRNKYAISLSEDWVVVIFGFLIIGLYLTGFKIESPVFGWADPSELFEKVLTGQNLRNIGFYFLLVYGVAILATAATGKKIVEVAKGFPLIYLLTVLALILAGNRFLKTWNLEAVLFSLLIGLILGNLFRVPQWLKNALSTELYVKIGLVLLGTSIIFSDILKAGSLGFIQALLVVLAVWYFAFWLCKRMGIDEELSVMISSAVSICGVSAAIASAGAIKGDTKKLSYVISIVLITAIPMILFMPFIARMLGLSEAVTGAWLGGSIDTTGAVIASGSLVGEEALKISTIVKFSQNVLLGVAAFFISIYWSYSKNTSASALESRPTLKIIWERFPKFVLGFIAASLLFSWVLSPQTTDELKGDLKAVQGVWFALAFTSIGLETKFSELFNHEGRKPFFAFLLAQLFNILFTLGVAYFLFR